MALQHPPSLHAFLDAGCDLVETGVWIDSLAHLVFLELPFMPATARRDHAERSRDIANALLAQDGPDLGLWWGWVLFEHWAAEVYSDPLLAQRLQEALPADMASRYRILVDRYRRPYPLQIQTPDSWWSCANCGAAFDEGEAEALVIEGREDHSELAENITYCLECVDQLAAAALSARRPR